MHDISFDKLFLLAIAAVVLMGPQRLPGYAEKRARFVRAVRTLTNGAKERLREEVGPEFDDIKWEKLDPRLYDPRRIVRDALFDDSPPVLQVTERSPGLNAVKNEHHTTISDAVNEATEIPGPGGPSRQ